MNVSYYIARRYLLSKKSLNAINIISGISMLGVFVGSAALVIILSVFNGFEKLVLSMYNTFTPELRIEPALGKSFADSGKVFEELKRNPAVALYTEVLQEKSLVRYGNGQYIGLVKGVSDNFIKDKNVDSNMVHGKFMLHDGEENFAIIGSVAQSYLGVNVDNDFNRLQFFSPKKNAGNSINPADEFTAQTIRVSGIFEIQKDFDEMIIVPINFARSLFDEEKNISAVEISLKPGENENSVQKEISRQLGKKFLVKNRMQQNALLYKVLNSEKWAIFIILTFVLIIAIFNIIGSLTMLVIDKRKDIAILSSMGAGSNLIKNVFLIEGMLISVSGCIAGIITGLIFCILQQRYGFIKMAGANMVVDSYPIGLKATDFLLVFCTVMIISLIASLVSSRLSIKHALNVTEAI
ncbi:FtsX-like permease family protein [Pedobacter sp. HMF7647]|uniref:FtsX-like permease family protein n=1 Tax=Hufsiella arboris TaxID=2695275 RepID=A0A7K1Y4N9_9SPHI|nr:ABC transporter permease [Hufsiella arboris]MXV49547.1 FtsX-like permease family protein [Hufsiella arboris]